MYKSRNGIDGTYKSRNGNVQISEWLETIEALLPQVAVPLDGGDVAVDAVPGLGDDHVGALSRCFVANAWAMQSPLIPPRPPSNQPVPADGPRLGDRGALGDGATDPGGRAGGLVGAERADGDGGGGDGGSGGEGGPSWLVEGRRERRRGVWRGGSEE
ncbi:hypothetical protein NL676_001429 [Syzygium grande]|nr:hypothetical protein NL676_001429 [Syzygium grande]